MKKHSRESTSTGATADEAARELELAEKFGLTKAEVEALFEQLERAGDIRKTGRFRRGRPVYVTTEKGKTEVELNQFFGGLDS